MAVVFQRASGSTGTSHTIDIGVAGNDRLVVAILGDESSTAGFNGTVSIGGTNFTQGLVANNTVGIGNHNEMHWAAETTLGALAGSQSVSYSAGDAAWAIHVMVFYGVNDSETADDTSLEETTSVDFECYYPNSNIPANGLLVMGAGNGQSGTYNVNDHDTSPTENTDDALTPEIECTQSTSGPNPGSAVLATAYFISTLGTQTARHFRARNSVSANRSSGTLATFEEASTGVTVTPTVLVITVNQVGAALSVDVVVTPTILTITINLFATSFPGAEGDQNMTIRVRNASASPFFKPVTSSGVLTKTGMQIGVTQFLDE